MTHLILRRTEIDVLRSTPTAHKSKSGFAHFIVTLGELVDPDSGSITLTPEQVQRIQRYISRYSGGGYQGILMKAFSRALNLKKKRVPAPKKKAKTK